MQSRWRRWLHSSALAWCWGLLCGLAAWLLSGPAWASSRGDDWLAAVLGILVGGPAVLLCVVMSILSAALKRRAPHRWHVSYSWFALGLSLLLCVGLPSAAWWLFGGTRGAYDAALFAFPVVVAGGWSAWLAWQLKSQRARGQ